MHNTALATIDLSALRNNLTTVRTLCPRSRIMAVLKANAYGHGLIPVARALCDADGFAVARLSEAISLRSAGIRQRILVLGTLLDVDDIGLCSRFNIDITVHDRVSFDVAVSQSRGHPIRVWLKLDSGMHRVGFSPPEFIAADGILSRHPGVRELIHMTHLSCADEEIEATTNSQISRFGACHLASSPAQVSLANSAALLKFPNTRTDWVRPGLMLYGASPFSPASGPALDVAMTFSSLVIAVRQIAAGESVGYNCRWTSARMTRIGTIGVGYGDGYPRHAPNGTPVVINKQIAPLVGQVSMDSLTVDLTECTQVNVGDEAILWGPTLRPDLVARHVKTVAHGLLTSIHTRVTRSFIG